MAIDPNLSVTIMGALAMAGGVVMMYVPPRRAGADAADSGARVTVFGVQFEAKAVSVIVFLAGVALIGLPFTQRGQVAVKDASRALGVGPDYASRFAKPQGYFEERGNLWTEVNTGTGDFATFKLADDHGPYITLYDESRNFYVRLPKQGGTAQWSWPNPLAWIDLFLVTPEPKSST